MLSSKSFRSNPSTVKVYFKGEVRRWMWQDSFAGLVELRYFIDRNMANLAGNLWELKWKDEEGDLVNIVTSDDLDLAIEACFTSGSPILHLHVSVIEQPQQKKQQMRCPRITACDLAAGKRTLRPVPPPSCARQNSGCCQRRCPVSATDLCAAKRTLHTVPEPAVQHRPCIFALGGIPVACDTSARSCPAYVAGPHPLAALIRQAACQRQRQQQQVTTPRQALLQSIRRRPCLRKCCPMKQQRDVELTPRQALLESIRRGPCVGNKCCSMKQQQQRDVELTPRQALLESIRRGVVLHRTQEEAVPRNPLASHLREVCAFQCAQAASERMKARQGLDEEEDGEEYEGPNAGKDDEDESNDVTVEIDVPPFLSAFLKPFISSFAAMLNEDAVAREDAATNTCKGASPRGSASSNSKAADSQSDTEEALLQAVLKKSLEEFNQRYTQAKVQDDQVATATTSTQFDHEGEDEDEDEDEDEGDESVLMSTVTIQDKLAAAMNSNEEDDSDTDEEEIEEEIEEDGADAAADAPADDAEDAEDDEEDEDDFEDDLEEEPYGTRSVDDDGWVNVSDDGSVQQTVRVSSSTSSDPSTPPTPTPAPTAAPVTFPLPPSPFAPYEREVLAMLDMGIARPPRELLALLKKHNGSVNHAVAEIFASLS